MASTSAAAHAAGSLETAEKLARRQVKLARLQKLWEGRLRFHQNARLTTAAVFFILLAILTMRPSLRLELPLAVVFGVAFTILVIRTRRIHRHVERMKRLGQFLGRQEKRLRGLPSGRSWKSAMESETRVPIVRDLGLLGSHSLWTLLDETLTEGGQNRLLEWLSEPPLRADVILARQARTQRLRRETWFYTRLGLEADADEFKLSSRQIMEAVRSSFVTEKFNLALVGILALWLVAMGVTIAKLSGAQLPVGPSLFFTVFAIVNLSLLAKLGSAFMKGVGLSHHLSLLGPIFERLEARLRVSAELRALCPTTTTSGPSRNVRRLNRVLAFLSTQANPLLHFLLNAFLPWTIVATFFLERSRKRIAASFPLCMEELSELEAVGSLLVFDRYQTRTYPEVREVGRAPEIDLDGMYHPLIDRSRVVANDFHFPPGKSLGLLTGSNMSGKSTFLRTLGVNQVLANLGAPVFAAKFRTCPLRLETCIEVSDSLRDGFSYFYAEVRRLKELLSVARSGDAVLFLVDEIFRGTNNRERHIGSRAVIRELARAPRALGFISTHDLELTSLEANHPSLLNLHVREDIDEAGRMLFSYHLRLGPCPTTNALRIMAAEGIDVESV